MSLFFESVMNSDESDLLDMFPHTSTEQYSRRLVEILKKFEGQLRPDVYNISQHIHNCGRIDVSVVSAMLNCVEKVLFEVPSHADALVREELLKLGEQLTAMWHISTAAIILARHGAVTQPVHKNLEDLLNSRVFLRKE